MLHPAAAAAKHCIARTARQPCTCIWIARQLCICTWTARQPCTHARQHEIGSQCGVSMQGCAEIRWLAEKMGAKSSTVSGLSGLGDIMLTCYGSLSRNRWDHPAHCCKSPCSSACALLLKAASAKLYTSIPLCKDLTLQHLLSACCGTHTLCVRCSHRS